MQRRYGTPPDPPNAEYATIYAQDITERQEAEEEIQRNLAELQAKNEELDRFNRVAVDRELRMIELKREINALLVELGRAEKFKLDF